MDTMIDIRMHEKLRTEFSWADSNETAIPADLLFFRDKF